MSAIRLSKKSWVVGALVLAVAVVAFAAPKFEIVPISETPYRLLSVERTYLPCADVTVFCYKGYVCDDPAISYFIVGLSPCAIKSLVQYVPGGVEIGYDKKTGITGIKWETSVEPGETATFCFALKGDWSLVVFPSASRAACSSP